MSQLEPGDDTPGDSLAAALDRHGLAVDPAIVPKLEAYARLLWQWNEKLNLTRHTDWDKFAARDVLDSHRLAGLLQAGETVLDVGSGGGVPGLLLAMLRPDVRVSVCDSVAKKAAVLDDLVRRLDLPADVLHAPAQQVLEEGRFRTLTVRAVGPLAKLLRWFEPHWPAFGRLLVVKGPKWVEERGEARHLGLLKDKELRVATEYPMPGTDSRSVILQIWPKSRREAF